MKGHIFMDTMYFDMDMPSNTIFTVISKPVS